MKRIIVAALCIVICPEFAFGGDVAKFYVSSPHRDDAPASSVPATLQRGTGDVAQDLISQQENSFELIGYSAFNGVEPRQGEIRDQAKKIFATLVIYGGKYTGTQSTGGISTNTFSRFGGISLFFPTSITRSDNYVLFFHPFLHKGLGAFARFLKPEEAAALGSNKGILVMAVVRGSPAFEADILPGDVILSINGAEIYDGPTTKAAMESAYGTKAKVVLKRKSETMEKAIQISATGTW